MNEKKYVWLNLNDGTFSNSWNESDHIKYFKDAMPDSAKGWKLIEYICVNDADFKFYNKMKIVTNIQ